MKPSAFRRVPETTVVRLSRYLRTLEALGNDPTTVSSFELADAVGVNAATIRRDLSLLGTYGTRGTGYDIDQLVRALQRNLGVGRRWPVAIVGAGNLGRALSRSRGFNDGGFTVVALIDVDRTVVDVSLDGLVVTHVDRLSETIAEHGVSIGVVATPPNVAQEIGERLVASGVRRILNFAPVAITLEDASVRNVDLAAELQVLAFFGDDGARAATGDGVHSSISSHRFTRELTRPTGAADRLRQSS